MFIPKDFSEAFFPMKISNWIFGIGVIEYPLGHPRVSLSAIYTIFCLILAMTTSITYKKNYHGYYGDQANSNNIVFLALFIYGNVLFFFIAIITERIYRKVYLPTFTFCNLLVTTKLIAEYSYYLIFRNLKYAYKKSRM